jgi:hypothetical protein
MKLCSVSSLHCISYGAVTPAVNFLILVSNRRGNLMTPPQTSSLYKLGNNKNSALPLQIYTMTSNSHISKSLVN